MVTRPDTMSRYASCSSLCSDQSISLPPIQSRDTPSSYHGITLPPIQLKAESQAGQPRVEWQEPKGQQLQPSPCSEPPSRLPTGQGWRTSAPTWKFSGQKQLSDTSPRADGNTGTLARGARRILTPQSPSKANGAQRAAVCEDGGSLPFLPANEPEYVAKSRPFTSSPMHAMPTPPTQINEQQYESPSNAWYPTHALHVSGSTIQAPASPGSTKVGRQPQASHLNSLELSLVTTVQPEVIMQSQTPPGGPYVTAVTKAQGSSFLSGSAVSSKQTSASNPVQIMTITTSDGSYDLEVDVFAASRAADEKRSRNAGASARFRQRRKEKEKEADNRIKELEQERDFYRGDRDRLRDVVFNTPGLKHHARWRPSSPQAMPSASFQELMPQTAHSQPISQTAFQVKHPTSQRTSKRRRTDTRGGYTSTNDCSPTTTLTPMQSFSPQSTLPSAKTASKTLLPRATWSQGFDHHVIGIYRQEWPGDGGRGQQNRYSTLSSCVGRTNHLPTSTLCNFPSSDQPSYAFRRMNSAVI